MTPTSTPLDLQDGYGATTRTLSWPESARNWRKHGSPDSVHRLAELSNEKYADYGYRNDATTYAEVSALHPRRVLAWTSFPSDATRFVFDD